MQNIFMFCFRLLLGTSISGVIYSQLLKTLLKVIVTKKFNLRMLTADADFPSSHTAFVSSYSLISFFSLKNVIKTEKVEQIVATMAAILIVFIIVFCFITIRDALGVRRMTGQNASNLKETLTLLSKENIVNSAIQERFSKIAEEISVKSGHLPHEVVGGGFVGALIATTSANKFIYKNEKVYIFLIIGIIVYTIFMCFWVKRSTKQ